MSRLLPFALCICTAAGTLLPAAVSTADTVHLETVRRQLAEVEIEALRRQADSDIAAGDWAAALAGLTAARLQSESLPLPQRESLLSALDRRLAEVQAMRRNAEQRSQAEARAEAQASALAQRDDDERDARSRLEVRLQRVLVLAQRGLHELALEQARVLASDFPEEELAQEAYRRALETVHKARRLDTDARMEELKQELTTRIGQTLVPTGFDGLPQYPLDWFARDQRQAAVIGDELPADTLELRNRLAERIDVRFDAVDPAACIDDLVARTGINMIVDSAVRGNPRTTVTLTSSNMRIDRVLDWIVQQCNLYWRIEKGVVFIDDEEDQEVFTRVYDVGLLLYTIPDQPGVRLGINDGSEDFVTVTQTVATDQGLAGEDLLDLITVTLGEDRWGDGRSVTVQGTQLIATCTASMHESLVALLRQLSDSEEIQVHTAVRWVSLSKKYVEKIGVQWTDPGNLAVDSLAPPAAVLPDSMWNVNYPSGGTQTGVLDEFPGYRSNSSDRATIGAINNHLLADPVPPSLIGDVPGLSVSYGLLGSSQLLAVFQAVEQYVQNRSLESIALTARNGSQANAFLGITQTYIADYDVVTTTTASGYELNRYDPILRQLNTGQMLEIRPLVSADRKYVTLDLRPALVDVNLNRTVPISAINVTLLGENPSVLALLPPGSLILVVTGGEDGNEVTQYFLAETSIFRVQVPRLEVVNVNTRVMIPDRGSVLVGGFRQSRREKSRSQVPVLGNIPFLGRLFGVRGQSETDQELFLLVSARIILYPELEAQL